MPVILKQGDLLIVTLRTALTDDEYTNLRDRLVRKVGEVRSQAVIIDVSAVDVMDSFASRMLSSIAQIVRLRGAKTIVVGIQPEVAFTMVQLGLLLTDVQTALDLEDGLRLLGKEV